MAPHSVHLDREEPPCSGPETVPEEVVLGLLERVDTGGTEGSPKQTHHSSRMERNKKANVSKEQRAGVPFNGI